MNKIACMIVTYNRWELLDRCLKALEEQTYQGFDVLIVDNGSTDGTADYLRKRTDVTTVTVMENEGMANGYNVGYETVFLRGYDWIWTMDDDGLPEKNQLEELVKAAQQSGLYYLNSLVCDINNPKQLAFGLSGFKLTEVAQKYLFIYGSVNPDNGTFIHKAIFEKCGNIMKELISYGMETEYVARVKQKGFKVATVTTAIHYHQKNRKQRQAIIPFVPKGYVLISDSSKKDMFLITIRNQGYIDNTYYCITGILWTSMRYFLFYLLRLKFFDLLTFFKYYNKGIKGDFSPIETK